MLDGLVAQHGPIGHLCGDIEEVTRLLEHPSALRDPVAYAGFQRSLDAIALTRVPRALAETIRGHLA